MRAIERSFAVLNCLAGAGTGRTLQEISCIIGLAKSTTFRIVRALESMGYLTRNDDLRYTLTPKLAQLATSADLTRNIKQLLRPVLIQLVRTTGENVALHCVSNFDRVCVDVTRSDAPLVGMYRPGEKLPLGLGAASMVLMAYMSMTELKRYLRPAAQAVGCTTAELKSILETTRQQGFAVSHGGGVRALTGVSAPIFNFDGSVTYALAVIVPTARVSGRVVGLTSAVTDAAREASNRLSGRLDKGTHNTGRQ